MAIFTFIVFSIIFLLVLHGFSSGTFSEIWNAHKTNRNKIEQHIEEIGDVDHVFISHDSGNAIALNESKEEIYHVYTTEQSSTDIKTYSIRAIPFADIIESEVIIDNETVTKTSRGSQIGGAVVGGALLGGVGAVIGGLSGKKISSDQIRNIEMKLTINNLNNPICKINFLNDLDPVTYKKKSKGYSKDSKEYKNAIAEVEKWQGIIDIIMNKH